MLDHTLCIKALILPGTPNQSRGRQRLRTRASNQSSDACRSRVITCPVPLSHSRIRASTALGRDPPCLRSPCLPRVAAPQRLSPLSLRRRTGTSSSRTRSAPSSPRSRQCCARLLASLAAARQSEREGGVWSSQSRTGKDLPARAGAASRRTETGGRGSLSESESCLPHPVSRVSRQPALFAAGLSECSC